jgi:hypothetical protein
MGVAAARPASLAKQIDASVYAVRWDCVGSRAVMECGVDLPSCARARSNTTCVYALRGALQAARVIIAATSDCVCRDDKLKAQG